MNKRRWVLRGMVVLGVLAILGLVSSAVRTEEAGDPSGITVLSQSQPRTVFAYFYYWYDLPSGPHSTFLTDHPAEPDASYRSTAWFKKQLLDMDEAGVDVALAVYWGAEEPSSDTGLANMVRAATELRTSGQETPAIGMFLDTGLIGRWPESRRNLTVDANRAAVYELVRKFYSLVPREHWALVDGRPVVWLWGSWLGIQFDQAFFDYLYSSLEQDLGARPYIVAENSWRFEVQSRAFRGLEADQSAPVRVDDFYSWGASLTGYREGGGNVAQIGPGYDERQLKGADRTGRFSDRRNGAFYRESWEAAIASGKRLIAIETWNEFHEASEIADSREHGRAYINLTAQFARRFKSGT